MNEELKVKISVDANDAVANVGKTTEKVKDFEKQTEEAEKAADEAFKSIGDATKTAMASVGVAIAAGAAALVGLAESTKEYRTAQAKLNTAFEAAGQSAETANAVYSDLQGVLGDTDTAVEAAAQLAKLGATEEELADITDICAGVYGTFGDSIDIAGFAEAINHTSKLGEVQGTLADALEWSGVNVDDFNEELAECTDEEQRQKKIITTLNGLYKNTGKLYKENNKDLIASNKANENWNKTLAKMGGYVEPLITSIKEMGTALAEDCEEPIKDIVDFVTNKLIPTVTNAVKWIKENQALVVGIGAAVVATLAGVKIAMIQADLATKGLTISTVAQTAAQTALNAVMNLNPYTLALTALVALTAGIVAYVATIDTTTPKVEHLTEKEKELIKSADEAAESFREQKQAIEDNVGNTMAQADYTKKLADELFKLADASGKVKEGDEARAQFILNELNEAYGTEYSMINGVIGQYEELKNKIYEVINAKTAQSILELHNEAYVEAINNENAALGAVAAAYKDLQGAEDEYTTRSAEIAEEIKKLEQDKINAMSNGSQMAGVSIDANIAKLKSEEIELKANRDNKKKTYEDAAADYGAYTTTINNYEEAQAAVLQGNYQKAIDILAKKGGAYGEYADEVDAATQDALDALYKEAIDTGVEAKRIKKNFEDGVDGYTKEMVDEAEKGHDDAFKEWEQAYNEAYGIGGDMSDGLKEGLEKDKLGLINKAKNIISSIWGAMRKEADSHSPSRKTMALGRDIDAGLEIGIEDNAGNVTRAAEKLVNDAIKPINASIGGVTYNNGLFKNNATSALPFASGGSIDGGTKWISNLAQAISGNGAPIYLQVDGRTFAEITEDSLNTLTRQRGYLNLKLV